MRDSIESLKPYTTTLFPIPYYLFPSAKRYNENLGIIVEGMGNREWGILMLPIFQGRIKPLLDPLLFRFSLWIERGGFLTKELKI